jgi:acyl-coenzyme A thioesterase PaaI-like protein
MKLTPRLQKFILNIYPPYLGAGVKTEYISDDWRESRVSMRVRWFNRNAVGTHFGGSLYSMVDPHFMLQLMQILGRDYIVWDKAADIDFIKATRKKVSATIHISDAMITDIKDKTANGEKYLPVYTLNIIDEANDLIARVNKTIYIRKKKSKSEHG